MRNEKNYLLFFFTYKFSLNRLLTITFRTSISIFLKNNNNNKNKLIICHASRAHL